MREQSSNFIVIHTLTNQFEADLLHDALEKEKVPVILRPFEETPYDGLFVKQRGWGCLMVPDNLAFAATQIIQPLVEEIEAGKLYDDPSQVDSLLWERLRQASPEQICRSAQVLYDSSQGAYTIPFLEARLRCFPDSEFLDFESPNAIHKLNFQFYLVILHYLLEAQQVGLDGKWVSEKDIPGGQLFFRGPHEFPTARLEEFFGSRLDLFASASERLGGTKVQMGDIAFRFWPLPRAPLLLVLWKGDEEFNPALQIRFDATILSHLHALDTVLALVHVVCRSLLKAGRDLAE